MVVEQPRDIRFRVFRRGGADHDFRDAISRKRIFDIVTPAERLFDPVEVRMSV